MSSTLTYKQTSALTGCEQEGWQEGHSPPQLNWNLQQDAPNKIQENTHWTMTTKIQKTITLSHQNDGYNISCSARYPVNEGKDAKTSEERKTLNVLCKIWFFFMKMTINILHCRTLKFTLNSLHIPNPPDSPRDISVVISPTDPVSVGSVVNLTCCCRGNPPTIRFIWFLATDGRLELISVATQVYGFNVSDSDRGRLFYCGCNNMLGMQLSRGVQLIFRGLSRNYCLTFYKL